LSLPPGQAASPGEVAVTHGLKRYKWPSTLSAQPPPRTTRAGQAAIVLYVLALVAVVVGVDVVFFRNRLWERLMVDVRIVLVFAAFYFRLLKR
jgi:hypothetical protein